MPLSLQRQKICCFRVAGIGISKSVLLMKILKRFMCLVIFLFFILLSLYMIGVALPVLKEDHKENSLKPLSPEVSLVVDDLLTKRGYKNREDLLNKGRTGAVIFISIGILGVTFFGYAGFRVIFPKKGNHLL